MSCAIWWLTFFPCLKSFIVRMGYSILFLYDDSECIIIVEHGKWDHHRDCCDCCVCCDCYMCGITFHFFSFCLINDCVVCQQWTNQWIEIVCVWLVCWSKWMKQRWRYCCVGANSIYSQFSSDQSIHFCCRLQI